MKTLDDARWRAQKAELGQYLDQESAHAFIGFIEQWCERAEETLDVPGNEVLLHIEALRASLEPTEASNGYLDAPYLATMLALICANWDCGGQDTLFESMTVFEKRLVIQVVQEMTAAMQAGAEGEAVPDESVTLAYGQRVPTDG